MATSVPSELPQIVELFKLIKEREEIRQLQETAIAAQAEELQAQRQEVEDLRTEKQALIVRSPNTLGGERGYAAPSHTG